MRKVHPEIAAFLGIPIILLLKRMNSKIVEKRDVEQVTGLDVLGIIPNLNMFDSTQEQGVKNRDIFFRRKDSRQKLKSRKNELIIKNDIKSQVSESYRDIRRNLSFFSRGRRLKSIAVTSSTAGEGKSVILVNLALSMSQKGKKVIIVDADLRKPMQHQFFEISNFTGLSDILRERINFTDGLKETGIDGLQLITAGKKPTHPLTLLNSNSMKEVLIKAEKQADLVLIDTPPIGLVRDAAILTDKVDGTILVTASRETSNHFLKNAYNNLNKYHANILGVILNKYKHQQ